MQNQPNRDINTQPLSRVSSTLISEPPHMVGREYLAFTALIGKQTELPVEQYETFLTYDEVFTLLEPHATLSYAEGELSVKVLQERFQGTSYEQIFQSVPEGKPLAVEELYQQLVQLDKKSSGFVRVGGGFAYRDNDGHWWQNEQYDFEWQGRAIAYRLAALQLVPDLPVRNNDLDTFGVSFTSRITNSRQFELWQGRHDFIAEPFDQTGNRSLFVEVSQTRIFESDDEDCWHERASLVFCDVAEMEPYYDAKFQDYLSRPTHSIRVLLNIPPLPGDYFDADENEISPHPGTWLGIAAPLPHDLQPPEDLTRRIQ